MSWETVLLWLPLLACPLIMWWCFRGMSKSRGASEKGEGPGVSGESKPSDARELREEIGVLKARLALLEGRRVGLKAESKEERAGAGDADERSSGALTPGDREEDD